MDSKTTESRFLHLPVEIRLNIYECLLAPSPEKASGSSNFDDGSSRLVHHIPCVFLPALKVQTLSPEIYVMEKQKGSLQRTTFYTRADRFRGRTMLTTYLIHKKRRLYAAILRINRQIHGEAVAVLYAKHMFAFDTHVEAVSPFMSDLTSAARNCIKCVAITKRASPFEKEFDRAEWKNACASFATLPNLDELQLQVIASKPSRGDWHGVDAMEKQEMEERIKEQSFEWVRDLVQIKNLKKLDVMAKVEKCMSPESDALLDWVRFSKSIEGSFRMVISDMMVSNRTRKWAELGG